MKKGDKVRLTGEAWPLYLRDTIQTIEDVEWFDDEGHVPYFLDKESFTGRWYINNRWTAEVVKRSWIKRLLGLS